MAIFPALARSPSRDAPPLYVIDTNMRPLLQWPRRIAGADSIARALANLIGAADGERDREVSAVPPPVGDEPSAKPERWSDFFCGDFSSEELAPRRRSSLPLEVIDRLWG